MNALESAALWTWHNSLAATILIAFIFAVRFALRKSAPPALMHLLGLLIIARLLLPNAPQSPASVFNLVEQAAPIAAPISLTIPIEFAEPQQSHEKSFSIKRYLPVVWAIVGLFILTKVLIQHWRIRRWVKKGTPLATPASVAALREATEKHGLKHSPSLKIIPQIQVPALFGFFRPTILLPSRLAASPDLLLIFLHELAHLRRRHILINWLVIITQTLHWFNPLVWLAMRRLRADQELICDQDVMRLVGPTRTRSYGETLLALASDASQPLVTVLPISTTFKHMKERIRMISYFKPVTKRLMILLCILVISVSAATFTRPIEKKPERKTSKATTQSDDTVRERAALTVNALRDEIEKLGQRIESYQNEMDKIREEYGLVTSVSGDSLLPSESLVKWENEQILAEGQFVQISRLHEHLRNKKRAELRQVIPTAYRDEALDRYLADLAKTEQELAKINSDYSPDHPDVVRLVRGMSNINSHVELRIDGIMAGLETLVATKRAVSENIDKRLTEARQAESEKHSRSRSYFRLKRIVDNLQRTYDSLQLRLLEEEINSRVPKN